MALLVSQQSLVERLWHNASYVEQLQLLCGESGSGKTTILSTVKEQANEHLCAYVACPEYADDAEIRRKIWVQLLDESVFDDELSLSDTLVANQHFIQQPILILLDDAHRLSITLLAELMTLSQMQVAEQPIGVIAAVSTAFAEMLENELAAENEIFTTLQIEPLSEEEQYNLYLLLMGQQSHGREQVLSRPDFGDAAVYPNDIVNALMGKQETQSKKPFSLLMKLCVACCLSLLGLFAFWQLYSSSAIEENQSINSTKLKIVGDPAKLKTSSADNDSTKISTSGKPEPQATSVVEKAKPDTQSELILPEQKSVTVVENKQRQNPKPVEPIIENKVISTIETTQDEISPNVVPSAKVQQAVAKTKPIVDKPPKTVQTPSKVVDKTVPLHFTPKYSQGYTLQLATMTHKDSLNKLLKKLDGWQDVRVAQYNRKWVVVLGDFATRSDAQQTIKKLKAKTKLPAPWLRRWSALKGYNFR
ncbi:SPOR domain-containing protein [Parashewanella tropica]|uniref:SPOR domain-containing protein n=1 Tax=Parashewanella tropica TaxID=2547970 RepID=UPI001059CB1F|nr:AAA family ATPase [Parashewanella tropica]